MYEESLKFAEFNLDDDLYYRTGFSWGDRARRKYLAVVGLKLP